MCADWVSELGLGRMRESSSGQELKIKEVDTRIEREIAELRTAIQASKVSISNSYTQSNRSILLLGCDFTIPRRFRCVSSNLL